MEFEPKYYTEAAGKGYVVASLGKEMLCALYGILSEKSYLEEHPDAIQSFTDALQKGMDYVNTHTPEEIAKSSSHSLKKMIWKQSQRSFPGIMSRRHGKKI